MISITRKKIEPKLAEVAAKALRDMIIKQQLMPEEPIAELRLAEALGMSRTPVREAISLLEFEGVVRSIPGRGAFVVELSKEDFHEINDLRVELEPLAAAAAMNFIAREIILEQICVWKKFLASVRKDGEIDAYGLTNADSELHSLFIENCNSRRLSNILRTLQFQTKRYVFVHWHTKARVEETILQHLEILAAMENLDKTQLKTSLRKHLEANNTFFDLY